MTIGTGFNDHKLGEMTSRLLSRPALGGKDEEQDLHSNSFGTSARPSGVQPRTLSLTTMATPLPTRTCPSPCRAFLTGLNLETLTTRLARLCPALPLYISSRSPASYSFPSTASSTRVLNPLPLSPKSKQLQTTTAASEDALFGLYSSWAGHYWWLRRQLSILYSRFYGQQRTGWNPGCGGSLVHPNCPTIRNSYRSDLGYDICTRHRGPTFGRLYPPGRLQRGCCPASIHRVFGARLSPPASVFRGRYPAAYICVFGTRYSPTAYILCNRCPATVHCVFSARLCELVFCSRYPTPIDRVFNAGFRNSIFSGMEQSALVSSRLVSVSIFGASVCASILSTSTCSAILYCVEQPAFVSSWFFVFSVGFLRAASCPVVFRNFEQSSILSSWLKYHCPAPHCIIDSGKLYCTIFWRPDKLSRCIISRPIFWSVELFRGICNANKCMEQPSRQHFDYMVIGITWYLCVCVWIIRRAFWLIFHGSVKCSRQFGYTIVWKRNLKH